MKPLCQATPRKALSLVEMLVVVTLFTFVGLFVSFLTVEVARLSNSSLSMIPSELNAYRMIDRVRTELLPAEVSSMSIGDDGRTASFRNPAEGRNSTIWFDGGALYLTLNTGTTQEQTTLIGANVEDVVFRFPDDPDRRTLEISVSTTGHVSTVTRERDRVTTYTDLIRLRN